MIRGESNKHLFFIMFALFPLFIIYSTPVFASPDDAARIVVTAAHLDGSKIEAWVDIRDVNHNPVTGLEEYQDSFRLSVAHTGASATVTGVTRIADDSRGTAYALLIDISGSMWGEPLNKAKQASIALIERLETEDRMAIITFGGDKVEVIAGFDSSIDDLKSAVEDIEDPARFANTPLFSAIKDAIGLMSARIDPEFPSHRVLLVLGDGEDNASTVDMSHLISGRHPQRIDIPIYSFGYSHRGSRHDSFRNLESLARESGGFFFENPDPGVEEHFAEFSARIKQGYIVKADYSGDRESVSRNPILVSAGNVEDSVGRMAILAPIAQVVDPCAGVECPDGQECDPVDGECKSISQPSKKVSAWIPFAIVFAGLLLIGIFIIIFLKRRNSEIERLGSEIEEEPESLNKNNEEQSSPVTGNVEQDEIVKKQPSKPEVKSANVQLNEPGSMRIQLVAVRGPGILVPTGPDYYISKNGVFIGRNGDIRIDSDVEVSGKHCRLSALDGCILLEDSGSQNGTFKNGVKVVQRDRLSDGDLLEIGRTTLRFTITVGKGQNP